MIRLVSAVRRRLAYILARRVRRLPYHVAIIPDGNRRWARRRGLPPWAGHVKGYEVMKRILNFLWDVGVRVVTVYALSRENCVRRKREELEVLFKLLSRALDELSGDTRVAKGLVDARVVGDLTLVPRSLRDKIEVFNATFWRGGDRKLNICVCYSGRWEILEGVRRAVSSTVAGEEEFSKLLPLGDVPPPDLLVRTGGEVRLSNFMLWHLSYTELYFSKKLWPDFDELDMSVALYDYSKRERRFGA